MGKTPQWDSALVCLLLPLKEVGTFVEMTTCITGGVW